MKLAIIALALLALVGCIKDDGGVSEPTPTTYVNVPNWETVLMLADAPSQLNTGGAQQYDTLWAFSNASGSFIRHHGTEYRIKAKTGTSYHVSDSTFEFYFGIFTPSDSLLTECLGVTGGYRQAGQWIDIKQSLAVRGGEFLFNAPTYTGYFER